MNTLAKCMVLVCLVSISLMMPATGALAADGGEETPLVAVTPFLGGAFWNSDVPLENSLLYGLRLGFHISGPFSVEGTYGKSKADHSLLATQAGIDHMGLDLLVDLRPGQKFNPYLTGGWARLDIEPDNAEAIKRSPNGWEVGAGLKIRLGGHDASLSTLRLELRDVMCDLDATPINEGGMTHNLMATVGLQFSFWGGEGKDSDSDGDGVLDKNDLCPDTPVGALVDATGCPLDADGDGVYDGLDQCPDTPKGAEVDFSGCPLDSDGDGVYDGLDACPKTPEGAVVDASGCPLDSDSDGVFDGLDRCPDTAANLQVDSNGCPIAVTATEIQLLDTGKITTSQIVFQSGSAKLDLADTRVLDEIGGTLENWPALKIEISGHTDSQGAAALNEALSQRRAQAVLDYLTANFAGIPAEQYTAVGYGEGHPVAENDTAEGRAQNRRVEFRVLNKETLQKEIENRRLLER